MRKLLVLSALVVLVAVACGDDSGSSNASTGTSVPVRLAGKVNVHGQKDLGGAATLEIEQDDFYFNPTFVKASAGQTVKVELKNEGKSTHTFTIDQLNIDKELQPGATAEVDVKLPASGAVTYYCQFHKDQGMQGAFYFKSGDTASTGAGSPRRSNY